MINLNDDEGNDDVTKLSEAALAKEWDTPEEDEAWEHLDQLPSL